MGLFKNIGPGKLVVYFAPNLQFIGTRNKKGEGMSFVCRKEANLPTERVKRVAVNTQRLSYCRQNFIQLSKGHHPNEMEHLNRTKPLD